VYADPAVGNMDVTDASNVSLNANSLKMKQELLLKVPVYNLSQASALPVGSCQFILDLGKGLQTDTAKLPLKEFFKWTVSREDGRLVVKGDLVTNLPADFASVVAFPVKGIASMTSAVIIRFVVTNHKTATILKDEDAYNNSASLQYSFSELAYGN
jgi:hypothetical protein